MSEKPGTTLQLSPESAHAVQQILPPHTDPILGLQPVPNGLGRLAHFRLLKVLGQGGMGGVYLAHDEGLDRQVALKVMLPNSAVDPGAKERFLREARAAAAVRHDNVVTIYHVGEDQGIPFIAMEFLRGAPLDVYLSRKGQLTTTQALRVGLETAEGLAAAHGLGLIHRDIKPANLWLESPRGRVKILDFGIARRMADDTQKGLTGTGTVIGTPGYMSPEQARGKSLDYRTDLFSLGVVLYQLTTGEMPFEGDTAMAVLTALAVDEPKPVRSLNPDASEAFEKLIHRLLQKNPDDRPASALVVAEELRSVADQASVPMAKAVEAVSPQVVYVPITIATESDGESAFAGLNDSHADTIRDQAKPATERNGRPRGSAKPSWGVWAIVGAAIVLAAALAAGTAFALREPEPIPLVPVPEEELPKPKRVSPKPRDEDTRPEPITEPFDMPFPPAFPPAEPGDDGLHPAFKAAFDRFLANEPLTDPERETLKNARGELFLFMDHGDIDDARFEEMSTWNWSPDLIAFGVFAPKLTNSGFEHLAKFKRIEAIRLDGTQVTDDGLAVLESLPRIHFVGLNGSKITDKAAATFVKLKSVEILDLGNTAFGDDGLEELKAMTGLRELILRNTNVTDAGLVHLRNWPHPLFLDVSDTRVTTDAVKQLRDCLPKGSMIFHRP